MAATSSQTAEPELTRIHFPPIFLSTHVMTTSSERVTHSKPGPRQLHDDDLVDEARTNRRRRRPFQTTTTRLAPTRPLQRCPHQTQIKHGSDRCLGTTSLAIAAAAAIMSDFKDLTHSKLSNDTSVTEAAAAKLSESSQCGITSSLIVMKSKQKLNSCKS